MKLFPLKKRLPELYSEQEIDAIEAHISRHFGEFDNVLHEIVSPDIHVDICIINPTDERNYYTLVTMGMGAHHMKVPKDLKQRNLNRAEILVTLPSNWKIDDDNEQWYWPLRWLKILARLPGEHNTWLGYGHTVPNGEPFSDNTQLSNIILTMPYLFGADSATCEFPTGDCVRFYQMIPLYDNEIEYKIQNGAEALEDLFGENFDMVVSIDRPSFLAK